MSFSNPWTKFFWNDWENDPALRLCSFAAQGLWMRCLCIAAKADPTGYVTVSGRPLDGQDLARLTGASVPEVETLLAELERNGVFSRDRRGSIYSRRMVRDQKKAAIARQNGKRGGNPTLSKDNENAVPDNPTLNGKDKPHKPSANNHQPEKKEYAFSGDVVRLTWRDFAKWQESFRHIPDLRGELQRLDSYYAANLTPDEQKKWFQRAAGALAKRNAECLKATDTQRGRSREMAI